MHYYVIGFFHILYWVMDMHFTTRILWLAFIARLRFMVWDVGTYRFVPLVFKIRCMPPQAFSSCFAFVALRMHLARSPYLGADIMAHGDKHVQLGYF